MNQGSDILIVGASIEGLTTALTLQELKIPFTLVERKPKDEWYQGGRMKSHYISGKCLTMLQTHFQLGEQIENFGAEISSLCFATNSSYQTRTISNSKLVVLRSSELKNLLLKKLEASQLQFGVELQSIETSNAENTIYLSNGEQVKPHIIIGADGKQSIVAGAVCTRKQRRSLLFQNGIMYTAFFQAENEEIQKMVLPGTLLSIKNRGTVFNICIRENGEVIWSLYRKRKPNQVKTNTNPKQELLDWILEDNISDKVIETCVTMTLPENIHSLFIQDRDPLQSWGKGNCILLGSAAHPLTPFLRQEANTNIIDGVTLGKILERHTHHGLSLNTCFRSFYKIRSPSSQHYVIRGRQIGDILLSEGIFSSWISSTVLSLLPDILVNRFLNDKKCNILPNL